MSEKNSQFRFDRIKTPFNLKMYGSPTLIMFDKSVPIESNTISRLLNSSRIALGVKTIELISFIIPV
jgi:hypothetical protein